jgi:hypothetical protein
MACEINASPSNGLVQSADGSGVIKLKSNGVTTNALAWVNFNGTGTVAIRSSYNVSSITDNGTGDYTVNFATALSDANYAVSGMGAKSTSGSDYFRSPWLRDQTLSTSSCRFITGHPGVGIEDLAYVLITVHGN